MNNLEMYITTDDDCEMYYEGDILPSSINVLVESSSLEGAIKDITIFFKELSFKDYSGKEGIALRMYNLLHKSLAELNKHDVNAMLPFDNNVNIVVGGNQYITIHEIIDKSYDFII